jgi:hypothetical protein
MQLQCVKGDQWKNHRAADHVNRSDGNQDREGFEIVSHAETNYNCGS